MDIHRFAVDAGESSGYSTSVPNLPHGAIFRLSLAPALGGDAELETRRIS